jgi:hypothetical protein
MPTIHSDTEVRRPLLTDHSKYILIGRKAWPLFIKSQQAILKATQFVIDLNETLRLQGDMSAVYQKMVELDVFLEPLVTASENWVLSCPQNQLVDQYELSVAHALRCMSRIKLNR